jgi:hypothetical protein
MLNVLLYNLLVVVEECEKASSPSCGMELPKR